MILTNLVLRRGTVPDLSDLTDSVLLEAPRWEGEDLHLIFDVEPTESEARQIRRRLITEDAERETFVSNVLQLRTIMQARLDGGTLLSEIPEVPQLLMLLIQNVVPELSDPSSAVVGTPATPDLEV